MLQLTRATTFAIITEERPSIPLHKFNFIEYDQLPARIDNNTVLTGIISNLLRLV